MRSTPVNPLAHHYQVFETASGFAAVAWNAAGITNLRLPSGSAGATERALLRQMPDSTHSAPTPEIADTIAAAKRYFEGSRTDFSQVRIDLGEQEPFFVRVYAAVRQLGWGETTTYGEVAKRLGAGPEMARDVGQAMARNPVPLIIPCHRVLAAGGKVGGFSAPGGSGSKTRMLEIEGICVESQASFGF